MIKILIADDDELYLRKLKNDLDHPDWQLTFCTSSEAATYHAKSIKPDLVLLDNHFPKKNGIEMIPTLKEYSPNSKIILISSFFTLKEIERIILNQADYFILKPSLTKEKVDKLLNIRVISDKKGISFWNALKNLTINTQKDKISNIAIVEDDEVFSYQLKHYLEKEIPNTQINAFNNQSDFFEYSFTEDPELIFLDYYLSDVTGNQIIKKIKAMNWTPKIIIISSQENTHIVSNLHKQGITGYIVKDHEWKTHLSQYLSLLSF